MFFLTSTIAIRSVMVSISIGIILIRPRLSDQTASGFKRWVPFSNGQLCQKVKNTSFKSDLGQQLSEKVLWKWNLFVFKSIILQHCLRDKQRWQIHWKFNYSNCVLTWKSCRMEFPSFSHSEDKFWHGPSIPCQCDPYGRNWNSMRKILLIARRYTHGNCKIFSLLLHSFYKYY